jgi:PKD repeat protein
VVVKTARARLRASLGRTRIVLAATIAVMVVLVLGAGQAGAVVAKLGGRGYGITPRKGVATKNLSRAFRANRAAARARAPLARNRDEAPFGGGALEWLGGPVMHSVNTHVIYWDPNGEFQATTKTIVQNFFTDVQHDSGEPSNVFAVAGQYTDGTGNAAYSSTFAGALTDANAYPTSGTCTVPKEVDLGPPYTKCLFDHQLQTQLSTFIGEHGLPKGPNQQYFLLLPHKVATCLEETVGGSQVCSNNFFCAYHSYISPGTPNEVIYSDIPFSLLDTSFAKGCQDDGNAGIQQPNPDNEGGKNTETRFADVALKYISHEYIEAATDPLVNEQTAWVDENGLEIGDKCNGVSPDPEEDGIGYDEKAFTPTLGGKASSLNLFNQAISSGHFYLQSEWDNAASECLMKPLELTESGVSAFTLEGTVGEPVTFEGTVEDPYEDPEFSWDFGDGTEGTGEQPEHTYAAPGTYKVTVTPKDGLTGATGLPASMLFTVDEPPIAAFTFLPAKPAEGGAVKFDAEGSEDPDGSITEYAWDFGDGEEGSGEKPEHVYKKSGLYTVTLTVTDSSTQEASITHQVAVSGLPTVTTEEAEPVSSTAVTLNATVNPNGLKVTECKFEYGPEKGVYGSQVPCSALPGEGTSAVAVSATLSSLAPSTTIHYRIVAKNSAGEAHGEDESVTTIVQPTVTTGSASSVTASSATLAGSVNPNGETVSECKFEYGPTAAYGSSAACGSLPGSGSSAVAVSAAPSGLSANTTYHYRLVAGNKGGAVQGADHTFTTLMSVAKEEPTAPPALVQPPPPPPPPPPPAATSAFTSSAAVNAKTGAITLTLSVGDPGTLSWLATFQNGKFGVFAASAGKCKKGQLRLGGKCRPATIVFSKGRTTVAGAGKVTIVLKPSASAAKALRNALKRKASLPVSVALTFKSSRGGAPVTHTRVVPVKLKKH